MSRILRNHFDDLSGSFQKHVEKVNKRTSERSIHGLRVTIKRMRAFFFLMEFLDPKRVNSNKNYEKLKNLFREAGKIHDGQVQVALLKEFNDTRGASEVSTLSSREHNNKLKTELRRVKSKKLIQKMKKSLEPVFARHDNNSLGESIFKFVNLNVRKSIRNAEEHSLHNARKKLKTAHYVLEIFKKKKPKAAAMLSTLDPIEEKIGRLQDLSNTTKAISKKRKGQKVNRKDSDLQSKVLKEMEQLEVQIQKDFGRLKTQLATTK